jgi:type IV secretory pathway TrbL component
VLKTSRTVDRILDPRNDITLGSLRRAAAMAGRRVVIEAVQGKRASDEGKPRVAWV